MWRICKFHQKNPLSNYDTKIFLVRNDTSDHCTTVLPCKAPLLLLTKVCNCPGTETSCWSLWRVMLFYSCVMQRFTCRHYFVYSARFSVLWSPRCFQLLRGLSCRQANSTPRLFTTRECCCNDCHMQFNTVLLKCARPTLKKVFSVDVVLKLVYIFLQQLYFSDVQISLVMRTYAPLQHQRDFWPVHW